MVFTPRGIEQSDFFRQVLLVKSFPSFIESDFLLTAAAQIKNTTFSFRLTPMDPQKTVSLVDKQINNMTAQSHERKGTRQIAAGVDVDSIRQKSLFLNEIFREDVGYLKAQKNDRREQLEERMDELLQKMQKRNYRPSPEVCNKLLELSSLLQNHSGKNVYAFHSPRTKEKVDEIVHLMVEQDPHLSRLFSLCCETQRDYIAQYNDDPEKIAAKMTEFQTRFFHPKGAERGKPGTGDRAVLHNEVLR